MVTIFTVHLRSSYITMLLRFGLLILIFVPWVDSKVIWEKDLVVDICSEGFNTRHAVLFSCFVDSIRKDIIETARTFFERMILVQFIDLDMMNAKLESILTRKLAASTCVVLNLMCPNANSLLNEASFHGFFNKSYQWLLLDFENFGLDIFANDTKKISLNSQITFVNISSANEFELYDLHSKGQHLKSPLEAIKFGSWSPVKGFSALISTQVVQGISNRQQFKGITLRGVVVIDREDIGPSQVDSILSDPIKTPGISPFTKYHYALTKILQQFFNFTINFRITHGWSGRLPKSQFRLGLLGVVQRDEADIAASGVFNRINRFAEMDTIHQSWKFEAAFLYKITAELKDQGSSGSFLSPFRRKVWWTSVIAIILLGFVWKVSVVLPRKPQRMWNDKESVDCNWIVNAFAVVCQQGLVTPPKRASARAIAFVFLAFSLLMYNFYTSSVVGGLLSTQAKGPKNLSELMYSSLILSFEDIGYHKVIFRETNASLLKAMYHTKVQPYRNPNLLPAYTTVKEAVPYLKTGRYAFHCEMIDAYSEIARLFDPNEICDLRSVPGIFDIQIMNMIVPKRSAYTEMFRIALHRAREIGLINRELRAHRPEKPRCQSGSTVNPVTLNGVKNAFVALGVGIGLSIVVLFAEFITRQYINLWKQKVVLRM